MQSYIIRPNQKNVYIKKFSKVPFGIQSTNLFIKEPFFWKKNLNQLSEAHSISKSKFLQSRFSDFTDKLNFHKFSQISVPLFHNFSLFWNLLNFVLNRFLATKAQWTIKFAPRRNRRISTLNELIVRRTARFTNSLRTQTKLLSCPLFQLVSLRKSSRWHIDKPLHYWWLP